MYLGSLASGFISGMEAGDRMADRKRQQEEAEFAMMEKRLNAAGDNLAALLTDPNTGFQLRPEDITQSHADQVANIINRYGIASSFFGVNPDVDVRNPIARMRILPGANANDMRGRRVVFDLNMRDGSVKPMTWGRSSDPNDMVAAPTIEDVGRMLLIETNPSYVIKEAQARRAYNDKLTGKFRRGRASSGRGRGRSGSGSDYVRPQSTGRGYAPQGGGSFEEDVAQAVGTATPMGMATPIGGGGGGGAPAQGAAAGGELQDPRTYRRPTQAERKINTEMDRLAQLYGEKRAREIYWDNFDKERGIGKYEGQEPEGKKAKGKEITVKQTNEFGIETGDVDVYREVGDGDFQPVYHTVNGRPVKGAREDSALGAAAASDMARQQAKRQAKREADEKFGWFSWPGSADEFIKQRTEEILKNADNLTGEQAKSEEQGKWKVTNIAPGESQAPAKQQAKTPKPPQPKGPAVKAEAKAEDRPVVIQDGKKYYRLEDGRYTSLQNIKNTAIRQGVPWQRIVRRMLPNIDPETME